MALPAAPQAVGVGVAGLHVRYRLVNAALSCPNNGWLGSLVGAAIVSLAVGAATENEMLLEMMDAHR